MRESSKLGAAVYAGAWLLFLYSKTYFSFFAGFSSVIGVWGDFCTFACISTIGFSVAFNFFLILFLYIWTLGVVNGIKIRSYFNSYFYLNTLTYFSGLLLIFGTFLTSSIIISAFSLFISLKFWSVEMINLEDYF